MLTDMYSNYVLSPDNLTQHQLIFFEMDQKYQTCTASLQKQGVFLCRSILFQKSGLCTVTARDMPRGRPFGGELSKNDSRVFS